MDLGLLLTAGSRWKTVPMWIRYEGGANDNRVQHMGSMVCNLLMTNRGSKLGELDLKDWTQESSWVCFYC